LSLDNPDRRGPQGIHSDHIYAHGRRRMFAVLTYLQKARGPGESTRVFEWVDWDQFISMFSLSPFETRATFAMSFAIGLAWMKLGSLL
jgi:hypothetical protein